MHKYLPQVPASHYAKGSYRDKERWVSYWHQLHMVREAAPASLLEIGPGERVVTDILRKEGVAITTADIAPEMNPDVVCSVTALPFPDKSFDVVLAAEVLEHIRYEDVPQALSELHRVARMHVIVSLPHPGYVFSLIAKVPLLSRFSFLFKIPFFWKEHRFNGEHYWELGKRGYSLRAFIHQAEKTGLALRQSRSYADDPAHRFLLFGVV